MKRLAAIALALATATLTGCADAPSIAAPSAPAAHTAIAATSSSYNQPFNSVLLNACTGESVTIEGTQAFTFSERQTRSGRGFTTMEGVIDGVATTASGAASAFHQSATTSTRQASPEEPIYGSSRYTFSLEGVDGGDDFVVRVSTDFVFDPMTGVFTTTGSSEKADCR